MHNTINQTKKHKRIKFKNGLYYYKKNKSTFHIKQNPSLTLSVSEEGFTELNPQPDTVICVMN